MIDLHCHLLPGIDDGPADLDGALAQARAHVAAGTTHVVCTPHVSQSHANTAARIADAVVDLTRALADASIPLRISTGAEVSLSRAVELPDDELVALRLAGSDWLLVEPPLGTDVPQLPELLRGLRDRGHRILVAHPERCGVFHRDPTLLEQVLADGALAQLTYGSLGGSFGRTVQKLSIEIVRAGRAQVLASDAHDVVRRPPGLTDPLPTPGLEAFTAWAGDAVPAALLAGDDLPPAPVVESPRRSFFRR